MGKMVEKVKLTSLFEPEKSVDAYWLNVKQHKLRGDRKW